MTSPAWAPGLDDVARHIPTRTRDMLTPGSDRLLGTFTEATTPTSGQAQQAIDDAVQAVLGLTGPLPEGTPEGTLTAARTAVEWRAAADIELAYPDRAADILVYRDLDARAAAALATLRAAMATDEGGVTEGLVPAYQFPAPPPWGDTDL